MSDTSSKKRHRSPDRTRWNKIKRIARHAKALGRFSGPVASTKNQSMPSDEASRYASSLGVKFREPARGNGK